MLKLELFGPGRASYNGVPLANFPRQQSFLVLCYLMLNPHHPSLRDQISTAFWGEFSTAVSRKYLRNALWRLRQAFEAVGAPPQEYLIVSDESVAFNSTNTYWLDVEAFDAALHACQDTPGQRLDSDQAVCLEKAVELYVGDLLEGIYDDWCLYDRERLSLLYSSALEKLMFYHELFGQYERALAYGERILNRDNTREKVHVHMMRLFWLSGDRQAALAQYRRCAQVLREELNILPMKESTGIYQQMLNNQYQPASPKGPAAQPGGLAMPHPPKASRLSATAPARETLLAKVQRLQSVLEETRLELVQIEELLSIASFDQ